MFNEDKVVYTAEDIRFTTKGDILYAFCLGLPDKEIRIASLGTSSKLAERPVSSVELVGSSAPVKWKQLAEALVLEKPVTVPNPATLAYKIQFKK